MLQSGWWSLIPGSQDHHPPWVKLLVPFYWLIPIRLQCWDGPLTNLCYTTLLDCRGGTGILSSLRDTQTPLVSQYQIGLDREGIRCNQLKIKNLLAFVGIPSTPYTLHGHDYLGILCCLSTKLWSHLATGKFPNVTKLVKRPKLPPLTDMENLHSFSLFGIISLIRDSTKHWIWKINHHDILNSSTHSSSFQ